MSYPKGILLRQSFSEKLLAWWDHHGRKDLPWQQNKTSYRVWVSEIMLQQTQVTTVIPYFERFMATFPSVQDLANAQEDKVLHLWTGLGYYSRARNLHKAARLVAEKFEGNFPTDLDTMQELPGVGRSTAGAVLSISQDQQTAIMDGNVKRVLSRYLAIKDWPGTPSVTKQLWSVAERYTPKTRNADYTQAIMDLGATVCKRSKPICSICPFQTDCKANLEGLTQIIPASKPKKDKPSKQTWMLMIQLADGRTELQKRPATGIWASLYSFPEFDSEESLRDFVATRYGDQTLQVWQSFRHTFSHYHLDITPVLLRLDHETISEANAIWYNPTLADEEVGLAAPVKKLISKLKF